MADEESAFKWGAAAYPLTPSTANSLLRDADPARFWALDYFKRVLELHLGDRWLAETAAAGLPAAQQAIVAAAIPYDPLPSLRHDQLPFPLLSVFRTTGKTNDVTLNWEHTVSEWVVTYSLPPLSPAQREQLEPALVAVANVIKNRVTQGFDPSYQNGAVVWDAAHGGIEEITVSSERFGNMPGSGDLFFPTVMLTLAVTERQDSLTGAFDLLAGEDNATNLRASDGTTNGFTVQNKTSF
jgi:hypothetical protein